MDLPSEFGNESAEAVRTHGAFGQVFSRQMACDFEAVWVAKLGRSFPPTIAHLLRAVRIDDDAITWLLEHYANESSATAAPDRLAAACAWVQAHEAVVRPWLTPPESLSLFPATARANDLGSLLVLVAFGTVMLLTLWWLLWPLLPLHPPFTPGEDPKYHGAAEWWFYVSMWPGVLHRAAYFLGWLLCCWRALCWRVRRRVVAQRVAMSNALMARNALAARSELSGQQLGEWSLGGGQLSGRGRWSLRSGRVRLLPTQQAVRTCSFADTASGSAAAPAGKPIYLAPPTVRLTANDEAAAVPEAATRLAAARLLSLLRRESNAGSGGGATVASELAASAPQFEARHTYVLEGTRTLRVGLTCATARTAPVALRVVARDGTAHRSVDYELLQPEVWLGAHETHVAIEVGVPAPHHALKVTSPWLPQRSFTLSLHARDPATGERLAVGAAATCTVTILTHREWPVEGAATMPPRALFWAYVREVVRDNFSREAYWFAGMVFRALHASFIHPLLLLLFLDNLGSRQFFDGLLLATIKAFCLLQDHYSAQWFSVQASAAITDRRTRQPLRVVIRHCA